MIEYASDRMTTVVLTNAMLFTGRRRRELARLAGRPTLTLQSSIDGASAATHDRWRGAGLVGRRRWTGCATRRTSACRCASR